MPAPTVDLEEQEESLCSRAWSPFPGWFRARQPTTCTGAWIVPPQEQDFKLPLVELLRAPALTGYDPEVRQRAAPSHDSA